MDLTREVRRVLHWGGPPGSREASPERRRAQFARLRLLGHVEVAGRGTQRLDALGDKPAALLAYLHLSDPGASRDRDELSSLFWPHLDHARARRALRQAIHALRRCLGEGVVLTLGKHRVEVPRGAVSSDAQSFRGYRDQGRHELALGLYRGPFLWSAHLPHVSPELEAWVMDVRSTLARSAGLSALSLARDAARRGDGEHARERMHQALDLSDHDGEVLREVLDTCALAGWPGLAEAFRDEHLVRLSRRKPGG